MQFNQLPNRPLNVAILGSTGAVGSELLKILEARKFPVKELTLLASQRSSGKYQSWKGMNLLVKEVTEHSFSGIDLVFASAGGDISKKWKSTINQEGAILIDNSSAFRLLADVPLVVPEVNPQAARNNYGVIANPNCTTILLTLLLSPLNKISKIKRIIVSTYQSASGAGQLAMEELKSLTQHALNDQYPESKILPYSLAFNLFLHNSTLMQNKYCEEEMKMVNETKKILNSNDLVISPTCVRVPILRAHSEAVNIEFEKPFDLNLAISTLNKSAGIELIDDYSNNRFPMPNDVKGKDLVAIGRIRQDISNPNALEAWLCGDQIRKGAALNAIQIAELLLPK
tara:strand:- start:14736 stop:15761 length:1026 start_codon:yes stop_codon:yes gene_type:complete